MLEDLNPIFNRNPLWPDIKKLGEFEKSDTIQKQSIDNVLTDMESKITQLRAGTYLVHFDIGGKQKVKEFCNRMDILVETVRKDLGDTNKYVLKDDIYVKVQPKD